jgi:diguanylate cyclase (GGDEF)-like protein
MVDAVAIAERMRNKICALQLVTDRAEKLSFTVSLGVASTPDTGMPLDELIGEADRQLYRAKKQGRNCVCSGLSA